VGRSPVIIKSSEDYFGAFFIKTVGDGACRLQLAKISKIFWEI
jgi:hypothetical protein